MRLWMGYSLSVAIVLMVATIPSLFMDTKSTWYECIRPSITPPNIVFPITWTLLYTMIAVVLAQMFVLPAPTLVISVFLINLALNVVWSFAYFYMRRISLALIILLMIWLTTLYLVVQAFLLFPSRKWVGFLLLPYLFWITFATVLNGISLQNTETCKGTTS